MAGLAAARARGRNGGRKFALTKSQVRLAQAAMSARDTKVSELCREIGVTRSILYRYICPEGKIRPHGQKCLTPNTMSHFVPLQRLTQLFNFYYIFLTKG